MLQKNLSTQKDQDHTAGDLRPALKAGAEKGPDHHTRQGDHKSRAADDRHSRQDVHVQKCKRDPNSQCVDAGSHRHQQQLLIIQRHTHRTGRLLRLPFQRLPHHLTADECQQKKSQPVVQMLDIPGKLGAQQPAGIGHQRLKSAKKQRNHSRIAQIQFWHTESLAHRYSKGVHREPHADQQQFQKSHIAAPL